VIQVVSAMCNAIEDTAASLCMSVSAPSNVHGVALVERLVETNKGLPSEEMIGYIAGFGDEPQRVTTRLQLNGGSDKGHAVIDPLLPKLEALLAVPDLCGMLLCLSNVIKQ